MRKGHLRERYLLIGSGIYLLRETVGATDYKYQSLGARRHTLAEPCCKLYGGTLFPSLVEEYQMVARLN